MNTVDNKITFGEKLRQARKDAAITQEELAEKLLVSRQAVAKWENGRGYPDIENSMRISDILNISIDSLLSGEEKLSLETTREQVDLKAYENYPFKSVKLLKKSRFKDCAVHERFKDGEIFALTGLQTDSKKETLSDRIILLTFGVPGMPSFINSVKNTDKEFYFVKKDGRSFLVTVTDDFVISSRIDDKVREQGFSGKRGERFTLGEFSFTSCGKLVMKEKK